MVAARLGMTVRQLLHSISHRELAQWLEFLQWEQAPDQTSDGLAAALTRINLNRKEVHDG